MKLLELLWRKITHTKALEESSGNYETVFFDTVYRLFYLTGLSTSDGGLYLLYGKAVRLMILFIISSELWYLFSESSNLDKIIDNINVTIIHLIVIYRYQNMMSHLDVYKKLAGAMERELFDISTASRRKLLQFWATRNNTYLKMLLGLGSLTLSIWYVYPLFDDVEYNFNIALRLPFDYRNSRYAATYVMVLIAFHYISCFVLMNDLIMQTHLMYLLCQYAVLADCFRNILTDCGCEDKYINSDIAYVEESIQIKYKKRLGDLVKQHKFIVENTLELRKILSFPMLCQFMASSLLICFAGYQVTATVKLSIGKFLMSTLYLIYNMFELFIFCRWCDEIKIQSENIAQAIYESGWERGVTCWPGTRSRLLLIMIRASKPLVLTAGGIYDLSLASYSTLVKTSYSALTVLLRVRDD